VKGNEDVAQKTYKLSLNVGLTYDRFILWCNLVFPIWSILWDWTKLWFVCLESWYI
jgi:hypothetical protein